MAELEASTAASGGGGRLRKAFGGVLCAFTLLLIGVLAFSIRLFSVIKYESVIHEFDPYFNYRVTQFLSKSGIYEFWNWFDDRTWYPLGRVIGGTVYPGLTLTAGMIWWLLNTLNIPLSVETVCVFTAPIFSANASWATYLLTKEAKGHGAGLMAATILAMMEDLARKRRQLILRGAGLVALMCAYMMFIVKRARRNTPKITNGPRVDSDIARESNLRFIYHSNDVNCLNQLRMTRAPFFNLCALFRERELLKDSIHTSIEEQVAMFLLVVGHNHRFRAMQPTFRRSIETISRYFKAVLFAVGELQDEMIRPLFTQIHPKILNSNRFNPYFKDCIGAIDGTHVLARVPVKISAAFRGRKGETTQNVMAAVDFDLRFTYVLAGWEGSAHDALILANALERDDGLTVPEGKFYLVDAGYAVRPGFLPPYRGTRYHLKEYGGGNYPQNAKELFNLRHSSLRTTIERAFAAYKNRWKIVYNKPFHPYKTQVKVVLACAILHNWILQHGEDDFVPPEATWDPNPTNETHHDLLPDNSSWSQRRDECANEMWVNRGFAHI